MTRRFQKSAITASTLTSFASMRIAGLDGGLAGGGAFRAIASAERRFCEAIQCRAASGVSAQVVAELAERHRTGGAEPPAGRTTSCEIRDSQGFVRWHGPCI